MTFPRASVTAWTTISAPPASLGERHSTAAGGRKTPAAMHSLSSRVTAGLTSPEPAVLMLLSLAISRFLHQDESTRVAGALKQLVEEKSRVADFTPYQRKIVDRYYKNLDAIQFQRLSELATDLYLAEGKKRDRLWVRVQESLRKLEFPETRIAFLLERRDPTLLVGILKELESGT